MVIEGPLGRREPPDWKHVERFPYKAVAPRTTVATVNRKLRLPSWHWTHDQGYEGSCVGHGIVMERAITNRRQNVLLDVLFPRRRYDPIHVWNEAKKIDYWPDTNPGDDNGTSVRAGYDVARQQGLARVRAMTLDSNGRPTPVDPRPVDLKEGVEVTRWATSVDEVRQAIADGIPCAIGVTWYSSFDRPVEEWGEDGKKQWWIGAGNLGTIRGGHCCTIYGASDKYQAVFIKNSWGRKYPLVMMPYTTLGTLIADYGEVALVVDR